MAQVYPRISTPYMPNGVPTATNAKSPYYAPGELGCAFNDQNTGSAYLRVQLDSGATASTPVGAVAAGQLAFWKNQATATVTNDKRMCDVGPSGAINRVAGIFTVAVSTAPGTNDSTGQPVLYMCDLLIQGQINVAANSALIGAVATADTTANTSRVVYTTGVNTAPVSQPVGVFASSTITSSQAPVDVQLGFIQ
jgi:hypothetical protein